MRSRSDYSQLRDPYGTFNRNKLLEARWPALLRYAQIKGEPHPRYFMDLLFSQAFNYGREQTGTSSFTPDEQKKDGYRVCEQAMADIACRQFIKTGRFKLYSGSTKEDLDCHLAAAGRPKISAWILADGLGGGFSKR